MARVCCLYACAVFFLLFAGCTGESVRVVLPDRHPANPLAAEAPMAPIPDPFANVSLPAPPSRPEKHPDQRHEHHPGQMNEEMQMEDMQMEDDRGSEMKHRGHDGPGAGGEEKRR